MKIIKVVNPITDLIKFNEAVPKHKATVLVYMMDGCPHCEMLSPKWEIVKKILHKEPEFKEVMSADIDSGVSSMLPLPPVMGFPAIKVLKDQKLHDFNGIREVDPILQFLRERIIEHRAEEDPILKTVTTPNIELEILDVAGQKPTNKEKKHSKKHSKKRGKKRGKKHGKKHSKKRGKKHSKKTTRSKKH